MTSAGEEPGRPNGRGLEDMVKEAEEYYDDLQQKRVRESRVDAAVVAIIVWFASFTVLGVGAYFTIKGPSFVEYLLGAFLAAIGIGAASGLVTYLVRRRRGSGFAELGQLIKKMKEGGATSEDGLRLVDAMHRASLVAKKRKMVTAFEYGVIAFAIVALVSVNPGAGALAGVIVFLYFRFEALRESEREERRYDDSKRELLQSL
jgi:hypothetical protein